MLVLKQRKDAWTRLHHDGAMMRVKVMMKNNQPFLVFDMPSRDFQVLREDALLDRPKETAG